ncbi:hypothetical protein PPERSA_11293 [Pseudocohnilembus persalinus]|uniref:Uncharacterized protein n=1 Tax=Pseudocohnilembus persalinus TaxID=266149 RepID=A0A0V0QPH3_PSEPJ|nr:hypothetical protein PPERSA_11293 [Pseudocohnilembus persalinus]|eukprot:KRX04169.1 hypothetical protein PPERSA_11293 [Pseudocohnilembus persalinus]
MHLIGQKNQPNAISELMRGLSGLNRKIENLVFDFSADFKSVEGYRWKLQNFNVKNLVYLLYNLVGKFSTIKINPGIFGYFYIQKRCRQILKLEWDWAAFHRRNQEVTEEEKRQANDLLQLKKLIQVAPQKYQAFKSASLVFKALQQCKISEKIRKDIFQQVIEECFISKKIVNEAFETSLYNDDYFIKSYFGVFGKMEANNMNLTNLSFEDIEREIEKLKFYQEFQIFSQQQNQENQDQQQNNQLQQLI